MKKILFYSFVSLCSLLGGIACSDDDTDARAALPAPTDVRLLNRTESSLIYAWADVDGATAYTCRLQDNKGTILRIQEVTEPTIEFTGLTNGAVYAFSVCTSYKGAGPISAYTEPVEGVPGEAMPALPAPVPTLKNSTPTTLELEWEAVEYAIAYEYQLLHGTEVVARDRIETTSVLVSDLISNTEYAFRVKAIVNDGEHSDSAYSDDLVVETPMRELSTGIFKFPHNEKEDGIVRAFPGAEGAGMYTTGGRGGKVLHVTRLDDDEKEGSLRWAIKQSGARTIVFDVAGSIELKSTLEIANGNVTIAGQTAPGDGICLKGYGMEVNSDNVIIRYLRVRPGDENGRDNTDALGGRYMQNIIVDHCSLSWSTDECVSFYVNRNMTLQWCLIYESLRNGGHGKGSHGYGGIWGGAPASFHHNILAHHDSRNPRLDSPEQYADGPTPGATAKAKGIKIADRLLDFRNNVVYNFCNYPAYGGVGISMNFVGNCYKWGPASVKGCGPSYKDGKESDNKICKRLYFCSLDTYYDGNKVSETPQKFVSGNPTIYHGNTNKLDTSVENPQTGVDVSSDNVKGFEKGTESGENGSCPFAPVWKSEPLPVRTSDGEVCDVTTHTAEAAMNAMVQYCGVVRYVGDKYRHDTADTRVLEDVKNGTGTSGENSTDQIQTSSGALYKRSWYGIIDSQKDKGGYPTLAATKDELSRVKDSDGDGMPDWFEEQTGLDKNNPKDANEYNFDKRYTNLEMYLHYLVQDITVAQVDGGTYTPLN